MAWARIKITVEETPNPDARMFTVNRPLSPGERRSYLSAQSAADDPLASALFTLPHVVGVMILGDFCTVNKAPAGQWRTLTPKVKAVLKAALKE